MRNEFDSRRPRSPTPPRMCSPPPQRRFYSPPPSRTQPLYHSPPGYGNRTQSPPRGRSPCRATSPLYHDQPGRNRSPFRGRSPPKSPPPMMGRPVLRSSYSPGSSRDIMERMSPHKGFQRQGEYNPQSPSGDRYSPQYNQPNSPPHKQDIQSSGPLSPPLTIDLSKPLDIGRTKMGEQPKPPVYDPSKPLTISSNRPKPAVTVPPNRRPPYLDNSSRKAEPVPPPRQRSRSPIRTRYTDYREQNPGGRRFVSPPRHNDMRRSPSPLRIPPSRSLPPLRNSRSPPRGHVSRSPPRGLVSRSPLRSHVSRSPPRNFASPPRPFYGGRGAQRSPPRGPPRSPPRGVQRSPPRGAQRSPPRGAQRSPPRGMLRHSPPRAMQRRSPPRQNNPARSRTPPVRYSDYRENKFNRRPLSIGNRLRN